jgi:hypothetical protein
MLVAFLAVWGINAAIIIKGRSHIVIRRSKTSTDCDIKALDKPGLMLYGIVFSCLQRKDINITYPKQRTS